MTNQQTPAALRLAEELEHDPGINRPSVVAELRRLHAENAALQQGYDAARLEIDSLKAKAQEQEEMLAAIGAGGVEPLRRRECLHQISEPTPRRTDWLEQLGFELREHGGVRIVVDDCGNEREATLTERVLWDALMQADAAAPSSAPARDLNGAALASARHLLEADPKAHAATVIQMLDAMAQQAAPAAVAVPDGWKLAPVEPTQAMLGKVDGLTCIDFTALGEEGAFTNDELRAIYQAFLAAAPQPPAQAQEPFGYFRAEPFGWTDCAETDEGAIALYELPQAASVAEGDARAGKFMTVVYRDISPGEEARALCEHPKASAMSWSHALNDRDAASAQAKEGQSHD